MSGPTCHFLFYFRDETFECDAEGYVLDLLPPMQIRDRLFGWHPVTGDEASDLERELVRELPFGHVLKHLHVKVTARRHDRDDVACVLDDGRLCIVHLTWNVESDPLWPRCEFVSELRDGRPND